jgi:putative DNA methylase
VFFASVVDDPESNPTKWKTEEEQNGERERLFDILRRLMGKKLREAPEVYAEARAEMLKHCDGVLPAVYDPFAGGGSIPLEANRIGFDAYAGDLNPVAVLLNKCNLELLPRWYNHPAVNANDQKQIGGNESWRGSGGLAADIRYYSRRVYEQAVGKIGYLYPKVPVGRNKARVDANVIAWLWVRTVASPNPAAQGKHVPIASSFVFSTKAQRAVWAKPIRDDSAQDGWRFEVHAGQLDKDKLAQMRLGTKAGKGQDFICALTGTPIQRSYIQAEGKAGRLKQRLMAIVADSPSGRAYLPPDAIHEGLSETLHDNEAVLDARATLLAGALPTRAEITGGVCTAYGLSTWGHLFTTRQVFSLLTLSDLIRNIGPEIEEDAIRAGLHDGRSTEYSKTVRTFLALAADRCADFNNSLCRWSASNQKVMNLFGKQALPMVFDFAEANLLGSSVGSWTTCSEYVADCVEVIATGDSTEGHAQQLDAASQQNGSTNILVSTDPPYYNNISYAVLSDFFYVWLRRSIGALYPEIFGTVLVPKLPELIAAANRFDGDAQRAKQHFEQGFRAAFTHLRQKMDPRFPLTVYYAFKQEDEDENEPEEGVSNGVDLTTGWETLLQAIVSSGFQITATWPVRASQKWRMVWARMH